MPTSFFPEDICTGANHAISLVIESIIRSLTDEPELALDLRFSPVQNKNALVVDYDAENNFREKFKEYRNAMFRGVKVRGEESIKEGTDFHDEEGLVALVDMVDGTDLLERNLSNWCSAAVFFEPDRGKKGEPIIRAACVGLPSGKIYYAHANIKEVRYEQFLRHDHRYRPGKAKGISSIRRLENCSICFYGQKPSSLIRVAETQLFTYLGQKEKTRVDKKKEKNASGSIVVDKEKEIRVYTLSGIPMMMKLIDHQVKEAANIDVIFQLGGQYPHDAVPGLYIAKKGGAFILNLKTSEEMTDTELEQGLLRPGHPDEKMEYIVASSRELCEELAPLLKAKTATAGSQPHS